MNHNSKKLNSHQKLIATIALIVTVFLAICVTFAWYTNKINTMDGTIKLGTFNYRVSLFDVDEGELVSRGSKSYTDDKSDTSTYENESFELKNLANDEVYYQVVKIENNSKFSIKAYEYLTFNSELTTSQKALSNYFYFKAYKMNGNTRTFPSLVANPSQSDIEDYIENNLAELPKAASIASTDSDTTFGSMNNNSVALGGSIDDGQTNYYLLAYCLRGISNSTLIEGGSFNVNPVVAITQANAPVPQTNAETNVVYVSSWHELKTAIANAGSGDTIYLKANIEAPSNVNFSINKDINLNLNNYTLRIHGDFVYRINSADSRSITVPLSSKLYVDGNLYIESLGPFALNGVASGKNIYLGAVSGGNVSGGRFLVNCGLFVDEGDTTDLTDDVVDENSGLSINTTVQKITSTGEYEDATLTISGSNTLVKLASGASLKTIESIDTYLATDLATHVYIINYGEIESLNLANVNYPSGAEYQVGLYVKNYNSVDAISLSGAAIGYDSGDSNSYNTRIIDGDGCETSFKASGYVPTGSSNFTVDDVEPFLNSSEDSYIIYENGLYTLYLRDTVHNSDVTAESIEDLFTAARQEHNNDSHYYPAACDNLRIVTQNGVKLIPSHFSQIKTLCTGLTSVDLSNASLLKTQVEVVDENNNSTNQLISTIPASAFSGLSSLRHVVFPVTNYAIGANAFAGTSIENISLNSNLIAVGDDAFDVNGDLEVLWNNSTDISKDNILVGFDIDKTVFFMEEALAQRAITDALDYGDWKLNMYEFYDFKSGDYYCKNAREGVTGCEIIYYGGSIYESFSSAEDKNIVPATINDPSTNLYLPVVAVKRQAFKKAIKDNGDATSIELSFTNCLRIDESAFEGTIQVDSLSLGVANRIGSKAFKDNVILRSEERPTGTDGFSGMISIGAKAFENCSISEGILDLSGPSTGYKPSNNALSGLTISGSYTGGENGNAVLKLTNVDVIPAQFAVGAKIYSNVLLNNTNSIAVGAFNGVIKANSENNPDNIVDIRDVKAIGSKAFNNIGCGTLRIGTYNSNLIDVVNPYTNIIGSGEIGTLELDGGFATSEAPALASDSSADLLVIEKLLIKKHIVNDELQTTNVPEYAFAGADGSHNIRILDISIAKDVINHEPENEGDDPVQETIYASYNLGEAAFKNADLPTTEVTVENDTLDYYYDFRGVVNVGAQAFYASTAKNIGLGTKIETIASWNFIKNCDNLKNLRIEKLGDIVTLNGGEANPNLKSNDTELSGFKIKVSTTLLTAYVGDTDGWAGWKNYFGALYYTVLKNYNATAQSNAHALKWYYNVIDPDHLEKGAQIVKCEPVNVNDNESVEPLYPTGSESITYYYTGSGARRKNYIIYYYSYSITVPKSVTNPFDTSTTLDVTQLGGDEDIFENIEYGDAYGFNTNGSLEDFLSRGNTLRDVDLRFELNLGDVTEIKYISAPSISSDKIKNFNLGSNTNSKYTVVDNNQLYYRINNVYQFGNQSAGSNNFSGEFAHLELVKVLPAYSSSTFTVKREVEVIQKGAFQGCENITKIDLQAPVAGSNDTNFDPRLMYIEADAFKDAENITEFDFTNTRSFISIASDVFGEARRLEVNSSGHYQYSALTNVTIKIPDSSSNSDIKALNNTYKNSGMYYFYNYYGLIVDSNVDSQGNSLAANNTGNTKLSLKKKEADETLSGISYHLMTSGTEYNSNVYVSDKSQFVAVVTGLSEETAQSSTVVIPSTVVVKGISYDVIAIADNAFGTNEKIQTLVLPSKDVVYSSAALAGCTNLGIIQYNDIIPFTESVNTVAALPTPSAKSLIENSSDEEKKG